MANSAKNPVNKWMVLISVGMGVILSTIDGTIVNIGLNTLVNDLQQPLHVVEWVVLAYMLTISTLMLSVGRLADMIGKKKLFLAGIIIFTVSSGLCGLSRSVYWLIAFRVLQAMGAVLLMAIGNAIVTQAFPPNERGKALGVMGTLVSVGIITGPTLGGLILQSLSWHWLFFVNLPVGLIGVFMVLRYIPEDTVRTRQRFDFAGAGTMLIFMASLLFALSISQDRGFKNPTVIALLAAALAGLIIFILVERRIEHPMVDLAMFRSRQFSTNLVTGFTVFICNAGTTLLFPLFLQNVLHYSTGNTGLLLAVTPVIVSVVAPLSGALSDRTGSRPITTLGLFILFLGFLFATTLSEQTSTFGYILRFIPIGIGIGLFSSPNNSAVMGSVPRENLGVASGILSLTRTVGQTTGIAILSAVWENRVAFHNGSFLEAGATFAPISAQVAGLQDTVKLTVFLIFIAFLISFAALVDFLKNKKLASAPISD